MSARDIQVIRSIKVGDVITADHLNSIARAINNNTRAIATPRQKFAEDETLKGESGGLTDLTFTEISRTQTTVQITDSNGDTHDIEQIDQVVLENASGDVLTLNFTNP